MVAFSTLLAYVAALAVFTAARRAMARRGGSAASAPIERQDRWTIGYGLVLGVASVCLVAAVLFMVLSVGLG
jgi:cobalamin synthase